MTWYRLNHLEEILYFVVRAWCGKICVDIVWMYVYNVVFMLFIVHTCCCSYVEWGISSTLFHRLVAISQLLSRHHQVYPVRNRTLYRDNELHHLVFEPSERKTNLLELPHCFWSETGHCFCHSYSLCFNYHINFTLIRSTVMLQT